MARLVLVLGMAAATTAVVVVLLATRWQPSASTAQQPARAVEHQTEATVNTPQLDAQRVVPGATLAPLPRTARVASVQAVPERGSGVFTVAPGTGHQVGRGPVTSYTVEVESDLPLATRATARLVEAVLSDPRGWTANDNHALQRTDVNSDIRVLIATPETTDALCAPLDTAGRLSCRTGGRVVLNAWRWIHGAEAYGSDLRNYRRYLINHEVGHALGNPHESCPGPNKLAPVMMQQTKGVDSCLPNPWPVAT